MLTIQDIEDLEKRRRDPITVGELPYDVWMRLGLAQSNVYMGYASLLHIFEKHKDVTRYDLLLIPMAIKNGLIVQETKKSNCIMASYLDAESKRRYLTSIKIANRNAELWLQSFYRSDKRQTRRLIARGIVLQTHR